MIKFSQIFRFVPFALLLFAVALRIYEPGPVEQLRMGVFDQYQVLKPRQPADLPIRILDIDEQSLNRFGQWPWPRNQLARIIDLLSEAGAAAVVMDVLMSEPDRLSPAQLAGLLPEGAEYSAARKALAEHSDYDAVLAKSIAQSNTVIGFALTHESSGRTPSPKAGMVQAGDSPSEFLLPFPGNIPALPNLESSAAGYGALNFIPDSDGTIRRAPLFYQLKDKIVPSIDAEALRAAQGASTYILKSSNASRELSYGRGGIGVVSARIGALTVPTDHHGRIWIRYAPTSSDLLVPAWRLIEETAPIDKLSGHIVVVGSTAAGLNAPRATSIESSVPAVVIRAQTLATLISGDFLHRPDWADGAEILAFLALGLILIWLLPRWGSLWCALLAVAAIGSAFGGSWVMYSQQNALVDPVYFGLVIFLVYLTQSLRVYLLTESERKTVRDAFGRYLSPALVEQLALEPDRLSLGGEIREMSILFCDIRGFTAFSEQYSPEGLTQLINRFLTPMTQVILDQKGTIDKYMGDCIMAFWNAPLEVPDHALKACHSALVMMKELEALNLELVKEAKTGDSTTDSLRIGIGINTGTACVGNLGSEQRFDYSALGDSVNLASRLEGQSKTYGVDILLTEDTYRSASQLAAVELDLIQVVGKSEPTRIFALLGDEEVCTSTDFVRLVELQNEMLNTYRARQWEKTLELTDRLKQMQFEGMERYYSMFSERVLEYRATPPELDWGGVERRLMK